MSIPPKEPDYSHKPNVISPTRRGQIEDGLVVSYDDIKDAFPTKSVMENNDRLTAQVNVYYEQCGENPHQVSCNFSSLLPQVLDGVYTRRLVVGEEWRKLDLGWVEKTSLLVVENKVGVGLTVNPSEEEREAMKKMILQLSTDGVNPQWEVLPGQFFAGRPAAEELFIRSLHGKPRATYHVFPG